MFDQTTPTHDSQEPIEDNKPLHLSIEEIQYQKELLEATRDICSRISLYFRKYFDTSDINQLTGFFGTSYRKTVFKGISFSPSTDLKLLEEGFCSLSSVVKEIKDRYAFVRSDMEPGQIYQMDLHKYLTLIKVASYCEQAVSQEIEFINSSIASQKIYNKNQAMQNYLQGKVTILTNLSNELKRLTERMVEFEKTHPQIRGKVFI